MTPEIKARMIQLANKCGITDEYQHEIIVDETRKIIINKARGIGVSTAFCFRALMRAIFPQYWTNPQKEAGIMSDNEDKAMELLEKYVKDVYNNHFKGIVRVKTTMESMKKLKWDNGYQIRVLPCKKSAPRSYHGDFYFDEMAHYENNLDYDVMTAVTGSLITGGCCWLVSTPNGERGKYYDIWEKDRKYKKYDLNWKKCKRPGYMTIVKEEKKDLLPFEFDQEYCCKFTSKNTAPFSRELVMSCVDKKLTINERRYTNYPLGFGLDIAKVRDESCIYGLEKMENDVFRTYWCETMKYRYSIQIPHIINLNKDLNITKWKADKTTVGQKIDEELSDAMGIKYTGVNFSNPYNEKLYELVKIVLMDKKIILPNIKKVIDQIVGIRKKQLPSGLIRYESKSGKLDDIFKALGMAIDACMEGKISNLDVRIYQGRTGEVNSVFNRM